MIQEKVIQEGQPEGTMSFMTLTSEVTHWKQRSTLLRVAWDHKKGMNAGREGPLGGTLKASYPQGALSIT